MSSEKNPKLLSDWTFVDFSISQQEMLLHHEEDVISNLPLEIKIMLPTELSQLKIEQTD